MSSDGSVRTSSAAKSKQERIRDNQRRSRARRQEYLAELERRLNESNITRREAELQRTAFVDLQSENARLRALLEFAGVSADVVENFGRDAINQHPAYPNTTSLRYLKPKYPATDVNRSQVGLAISNQGPDPSPPAQHLGFSAAHNPSATYTALPNHMAYSTMATATPLTGINNQSSTALYATTHEWLQNSDGGSMTASSDEPFTGDPFHAAPHDAQSYQSCNALSPLSKAMLDRYSPNPAEMQEIRRRVAMAYGQPKMENPGFQVHDQVLLHILNEVNAKPLGH
ncbi:uncharacterized protein A1O9_05922 [Exophiala aquamarina CBS 119918]|uniref:BZIP domain-containing protein n=1 Tax=Exophiala aquamarina CBS 119918 TaxID=1182545 RepID=A0A072PD23_9EURO|nr:uncharacterized protein A1O9_05922 [Exophiala aquamarina CBS 119918]KEF57999.1 hypothetical protein A1O9_05922 [Exophiala aquamarina CBS 119918]